MGKFPAGEGSVFVFGTASVFREEGTGESFEDVAHPVRILLEILRGKGLWRKAAGFADMLNIGFPKARAEVSAAIAALPAIDGREGLFMVSVDGPVEISLGVPRKASHCLKDLFVLCEASVEDVLVFGGHGVILREAMIGAQGNWRR